MSVLDGKPVAEKIQGELGAEIEWLKKERRQIPGLTVIMAGDDPASRSYVNSKSKLAEKMGIRSKLVKLPETATEKAVMQTIEAANSNPLVHAILVQMPLPKHLDHWKILDRILPEKDVDCFHPFNQGLILQNRSRIFPCTPCGVLKILDYYDLNPAGLNAVVVGRSFLVGKPMAAMLSNRNATVTLCHSRTVNLEGILREADLVVAAVGKPAFITAEMVKPGAILIDVGINRIDKEEDFANFCPPSHYEIFKKKGYILIGDIHFQAFAKAGHYSPVPGGVGPLTVTMLMSNTVELCKRQTGLS
ncbi:MAG: bifunctional 5,10-methylenetetrahydrofolate dehydrogenase/5,10-methenyltetrahydrofolate cyclohydrolase [Candidatus Aminicenantes bacterium]|nr:bifunctional 5,10-methylenetetrahydrofolate dehydrogenase/5,10-methenyltetrahydrofolate cyclohydrolase [Acidobacteriota bacterium]MCG2811343.1 bifunctional 5,10-methylenetetrahydrofolate dehydrogenase/5,10-methenyltetrahydrofolate cyclohydrolase [Candidatus Aminicenantes bacterium]